MKLFDGQSVFVTGGTAGIGLATALAFAREGANVAVVGRNPSQGADAERAIRQLGVEGIFLRADVTKRAEIAAAVSRTVEQFGGLRYAVNNAGIDADQAPFLDAPDEMFQLLMDTNVRAVWHGMQYEIPAMLKGAGGAIVNMASIGGVVGIDRAPIYTAAKHAVVGLSKSIALEFATQGIRVNVVAPGIVDTRLYQRLGDAQARAQVVASHPMQRLCTPEEVAGAILYVCSDKAGFITGHTMLMDGGYTCR